MASDSLSRNQAARLLKIDPRTVGRWVDSGDLTKDSEGKFSREEVEELAKAIEEGKANYDGAAPDSLALEQLTEASKQALAHAERMFALVEKPMKVILDTQTETIKTLTERQSASEAAHLESMKLLGEMLMQKDERDAIKEQAKARGEAIKAIGIQVAAFAPTLLEQLAGKSGMKEAMAALDENEKAALSELVDAMSDESKAKLVKALGKFGFEVKKEENNHADANH